MATITALRGSCRSPIFTQNSATPNQLTLSLAALNLTNGKSASENVHSWVFNYAGDVKNLIVSNVGGIAPNLINVVQNGIHFPHDGNFDIEIKWENQPFKQGDTSVFTLTNNVDGISFSDFNQFNTLGNLKTLGLIHNVPGGQDTYTAYVTISQPVTVPEPVTYLSLATLLVLVGLARPFTHFLRLECTKNAIS